MKFLPPFLFQKILKSMSHWFIIFEFTALFNNMRSLKFKSRPTNAFFAAVNQMFGGFSQLTTTAEHCFVVWTVHSDLFTTRSAVVGGWEEPPNFWLTVAKNAFVGWALNFRVRMLLKGAVIDLFHLYILFSQYRSCDDTQEIWSFVLFITARMNMSACTLFNEQDKGSNLLSIITWSVLGKQNVQAKKVY